MVEGTDDMRAGFRWKARPLLVMQESRHLLTATRFRAFPRLTHAPGHVLNHCGYCTMLTTGGIGAIHSGPVPDGYFRGALQG